uniref:Medium-chain acyl-CoA ligase ACSF2, mitochondrial n=1 Tax=Cyclopterus lumpus TaxID=8103 RepID=A0A8C3B450_CYCLU
MLLKTALRAQALRSSGVFSGSLKVLQRPWIRTRTPTHPGLCAASRGIHVDSPPIIPTLTTSYAHGTSTSSLRNTTVGDSLLQTVERWPDREAVIFVGDGVRKTFAQLQQDVDQVAAGLLALGLQKGDRLGMWAPNIYEWVLVQFATARAGIIMVTVNPAYQVQEVEHILRASGCKAVVCRAQFKTQNYSDMLRELCPGIELSSPGDTRSVRLPDLRSVILLDSRQQGMFHFEDVMQAGSSTFMQLLQDLQKKISFDDPINIQFTSGTTGLPKGATLSHHNIVNNAYFVGKRIVYGTTENSPGTFCQSPTDNMERKSETVGFVLDHVEAKVVDPTTGQVVPLGTTGELQIRGYCVMLGYWGDEAKTRETITESGWYKTGDLATMDAFSYCRIVGRIKDMIIRGGENIYPTEIEQLLQTHPKIKEVQVVGVQDTRLGEEVCACIRLVDGEQCTAEEIKAFCKGQVRPEFTYLALQDPSLLPVCDQLPDDRHWKGDRSPTAVHNVAHWRARRRPLACTTSPTAVHDVAHCRARRRPLILKDKIKS